VELAPELQRLCAVLARHPPAIGGRAHRHLRFVQLHGRRQWLRRAGQYGPEKETSNAFELGLKGAPTPGVEFSASVFNTQYSNFIEYVDAAGRSGQLPDHHPGLYRPENIGKAKIYGAEFNARTSRWASGCQA
jgi:outer membrane receptor protein involved in Fe transport